MPPLSQNFEDLNYRGYSDDMLSGSSGWSSGSQYANSTGSYASSTSSNQSYYTRPTLSVPRNSQNLPSLTEMNLGNASIYSRNTSFPVHTNRSSNQYAAPACNASPTDPLEMAYPRTSQGNFYGSGYSAMGSSRLNYANPQYEYSPYHDAGYYSNGASYPPTLCTISSNYMGGDASSVCSTRRRRGNLPKHVTDILRAWFHDHLDHPYPTDEDKQMLIQRTNLSMSQVC